MIEAYELYVSETYEPNFHLAYFCGKPSIEQLKLKVRTYTTDEDLALEKLLTEGQLHHSSGVWIYLSKLTLEQGEGETT